MKFAYLLTFLLLALSVAHAEVIETDSFAIEWPDGYTRVPSEDSTKLQFVSKDGLGVTMTVVGHQKTSETDFQKLRNTFVQYAEKELGKTARRHGKIVLPLKREDLSSGAILFTLGGHEQKTGEFGLFFVHISAQGRVAQVVIEGRGRPLDRLAEFQKFIGTIRWKNEPNKMQVPTS